MHAVRDCFYNVFVEKKKKESKNDNRISEECQIKNKTNQGTILTTTKVTSYSSSHKCSFFIYKPYWKNALYYIPVMPCVVCLESFVIYKSINSVELRCWCKIREGLVGTS